MIFIVKPSSLICYYFLAISDETGSFLYETKLPKRVGNIIIRIENGQRAIRLKF